VIRKTKSVLSPQANQPFTVDWVAPKMTPARQRRFKKALEELCAMCPPRIVRAWAWWHVHKLDPKAKKAEGRALCEFMDGLVERFMHTLPVAAWGLAETSMTLAVLHVAIRLKFECEAVNRLHLSADELQAAESAAVRMYEEYWNECAERGERP
jgi:hypothetical protein